MFALGTLHLPCAPLDWTDWIDLFDCYPRSTPSESLSYLVNAFTDWYPVFLLAYGNTRQDNAKMGQQTHVVNKATPACSVAFCRKDVRTRFLSIVVFVLLPPPLKSPNSPKVILAVVISRWEKVQAYGMAMP